MKIKGLIGWFLMLIIVSTSSCTKQLDIVSSNTGSEELQWKTISDTRAGLMGIYGLLRAAMLDNNAHWMYGDVRSGDFTPYNRADLTAVKDGNLKASFPLIKDLTNWRRFYAVINAASLFIEKAPKVRELDMRYTEQNLRYDVAQARALRAFVYFYISRIWGDVPLLTKSYDDGLFAEVASSSQETVLAFAENELLEAAQDLPYQYAVGMQRYYGEAYGVWNGVLVNKITAYTLLAHLSVWQSKYINAQTYARFVIENYSKSGLGFVDVNTLVNPSSGTFSPSNNLAQILAIRASYSLGEATSTGHIESLTLAYPLVTKDKPDLYIRKDSINNIFTSLNDLRFGLDTVAGLYRTNYFTNYNGDVPIFSKIKVIRDGAGDADFSLFGSNLVFTRIEEIVLLYAEINAVLQEPAVAGQYLNMVRSRRGLGNFNDVGNYNKLLAEIFAERRRELMGEGWRWYDLIRYNKLTNNNPVLTELMSKKGLYWPIANDVLKRNSKLKQNTYWD